MIAVLFIAMIIGAGSIIGCVPAQPAVTGPFRLECSIGSAPTTSVGPYATQPRFVEGEWLLLSRHQYDVVGSYRPALGEVCEIRQVPVD
jgi:hypothetical protein